jgi:hypothetical protein
VNEGFLASKRQEWLTSRRRFCISAPGKISQRSAISSPKDVAGLSWLKGEKCGRHSPYLRRPPRPFVELDVRNWAEHSAAILSRRRFSRRRQCAALWLLASSRPKPR